MAKKIKETIGEYRMSMRCSNCDHTWNETLIRGEKAIGYYECPYCGCRSGSVIGKALNEVSQDELYAKK